MERHDAVYEYDEDDGCLTVTDADSARTGSAWTGEKLAVGLGSVPTVIDREEARRLFIGLGVWLQETRFVGLGEGGQ